MEQFCPETAEKSARTNGQTDGQSEIIIVRIRTIIIIIIIIIIMIHEFYIAPFPGVNRLKALYIVIKT